MKKLLVIILAVIIVCSLAACSEDVDRFKGEHLFGDRFVIVEKIPDTSYWNIYLVYDTDTLVEYIYVHGGDSVSLCPYYDSNGEVVIYGGS